MAASNGPWSMENSGSASRLGLAAAVLLARGGLQLGEALEAERLGEAHDGRGGGGRAPGELLGRVEGDLVEMVDHVLRDVLLRARELVEARGDVRGQGLVPGGGGGHRRGFRHCPNGVLPDRLVSSPAASWSSSKPVSKASSCFAPAVHGDERGFFVETFREETLGPGRDVRAGQPLALAARDGPRHPLPDHAGPGQARPLRARAACGTSWSTCGAQSPTFGEWEAVELDDVHGAPAVDPGRLRPRLLRAVARRPTSSTSARTTTTPRRSPASRSTTRTSGSSGRCPARSCSSPSATATPRASRTSIRPFDGVATRPARRATCTWATCGPR